MEPRHVKKMFPQNIINALFLLTFIFIISLICVLHPTKGHADEAAPNPLALDSKAAGFIETLTEKCPRLSSQEPEAFEIALKYADAGTEWREEVEERIESDMNKYGASAADARRSAETTVIYITPSVSSPWYRLDSEYPPSGMPTSEMADWFATKNRLKVEKKERFIAALIAQCPQLPANVINLAYKETFVRHQKTQ